MSEVPRRDLFTIGLVGLAHGNSHFYQLVLPSLFPFLIRDFGVSYTQAGAVMTLFFIVSGFGQPAAGFLVDRFGARRTILIGLGCYTGAFIIAAGVTEFWMFFPVMTLAAVGNCVFHPADFTILNTNVRPHILGRAFSVHTLGGNLGWALAPVYMLSLGNWLGWRAALLGAAALGVVVLSLLWSYRHNLTGAPRPRPRGGRSETESLGLEVLLAAPVLLCFAYFLLVAAAQIAVQNFLPPILAQLHRTPLVLAGTALTGFLLGASAGVIFGGVLADRTHRHTGVIALGLLGSASVFFLVAQVDLIAAVLVSVVTIAGFLQGATSPSRDLMVRAATPAGTTGRVFGFVYSGLDAGSALAPITVGMLLDRGEPQWALWLVAALFLASILTVVTIGGAVGGTAPVASRG